MSGYCMEGDKEEPLILDLPAIALSAEGAGQAQLCAGGEEKGPDIALKAQNGMAGRLMRFCR